MTTTRPPISPGFNGPTTAADVTNIGTLGGMIAIVTAGYTGGGLEASRHREANELPASISPFRSRIGAPMKVDAYGQSDAANALFALGRGCTGSAGRNSRRLGASCAATCVLCATSPQLDAMGGVYCDHADIAVAVRADFRSPTT